jgi:photosystem II stability/assembly factor-like uncharacterized protein
MKVTTRRVISFLLVIVLFLALLVDYGCTGHSTASDIQGSAENSDHQQKSIKLKITRLSESQGFADLAILSNGNMLAVGYDGHDPNRLYVSNDRGRTWSIRAIPSEGFTTSAISFIDDRHGWIVGTSGLVLYTKDGGESWEKLGRPTRYELDRVQFINVSVGYAASGTEWGCEIFRTTDGGRNWRKSYEASRSGHVFHLAVLSEKIAIAAINDDHLIRTDDGGTTWKPVESKLTGAASVVFTSTGTGWVVGRKGSFYLSTDQGKTWKRPENLPGYVLDHDWISIDFVDDERGIAVGNDGLVIFTHDGGRTWSKVESDIDEEFLRVKFHGKTAVILGWQNVYEVGEGF